MQLMSKRIWPAVSVFFVLLLATFHLTAQAPMGAAARLVLLVGVTVAAGGAVAIFQFWPQKAMAAIEDGRLVVRRKSAALRDLVDVREETTVVNFVPTNRTYTFRFRPSGDCSKWEKLAGGRTLAIRASNVAGGRRSIEAFADQVIMLAGRERAATPPSRPPEAVVDFAAAADDGLDADAIIARYLAARTETPAAQSSRPSFGRRVV